MTEFSGIAFSLDVAQSQMQAGHQFTYHDQGISQMCPEKNEFPFKLDHSIHIRVISGNLTETRSTARQVPDFQKGPERES